MVLLHRDYNNSAHRPDGWQDPVHSCKVVIDGLVIRRRKRHTSTYFVRNEAFPKILI